MTNPSVTGGRDTRVRSHRVARPPARRRRWAVAAAAAVAVLALPLTACTTARDTLGTTASSCFEELALASDAVHDNGTFAGVHLLTLDVADHDLGMAGALSARFGSSVHTVCLVSYRGTFHVDRVNRPLGPAPAGDVGHYAIVIVAKPQDRVLGTVVRQTQPLRFGHPI